MSLGYNRTKTTAAKMATHLRNEAESARAVATFRNLNERVMTWCCQHAWSRFVIEIGCALISQRNYRQRSRVRFWIADLQNIVDLTGADEGVNLRHLSFQFIAISLNQTTGNNQPPGLSFCFQARCFENCFNRFLLGRLNKTTCVNHNGIGLLSVRRDLIAFLLQLSHHHFAVYQILGTTQTNESNLLHKSLS